MTETGSVPDPIVHSTKKEKYAMSETPLTPAKWLRDLPLGIKDEGFCDLLLDLRQELIDHDFIVTVLDLVEAHHEEHEHDPRISFLHLVAEYHVGGTNSALDWAKLGDRFRAFAHLHAHETREISLTYALACYRKSYSISLIKVARKSAESGK